MFQKNLVELGELQVKHSRNRIAILEKLISEVENVNTELWKFYLHLLNHHVVEQPTSSSKSIFNQSLLISYWFQEEKSAI